MLDAFEKGKHYVFSKRKFIKDMGKWEHCMNDLIGKEVFPVKNSLYIGIAKSGNQAHIDWCTEVKQNYPYNY